MQDFLNRLREREEGQAERADPAARATVDYIEAYRAANEGANPGPADVIDHYRRQQEAEKKRELRDRLEIIAQAAGEAAEALLFLKAYTDPQDPDHAETVSAYNTLTTIEAQAQEIEEGITPDQLNGDYYLFDCMDGLIGDQLLTPQEISGRLYGTDRALTEAQIKHIAADYEAELYRYTYKDGSPISKRKLTRLAL